MTSNSLLRRLGIGSALIAAAVLVFAHPPVYFAKAIRGKLVDSATGDSLQGVSIVAEWQLYDMIGEPHSGDRVKVIEAQTTGAGDYVIQEWGPVLRPPWGALRDRSPMLTFFKSGYYPKVVMNERASDDMVRESDFDRATIRLTPFDGDFMLLDRLLGTSDPWLTGCWRSCPHYVLALDAEAKRLRSVVPRGMPFSFPHELERMSPEDQAYFLRYKK